MKNRNSIILILTIIVALLIIGYIYLNKQEDDLTVELYYNSNFEFDFESGLYKYNKIELTSEQKKEIIRLYKDTNIEKEQYLDLAFIGAIRLEFSDGNVIIMDENDDACGYINNKYCIELSNGFKEYILNIID